jgi:hypothetical protein
MSPNEILSPFLPTWRSYLNACVHMHLHALDYTCIGLGFRVASTNTHMYNVTCKDWTDSNGPECHPDIQVSFRGVRNYGRNGEVYQVPINFVVVNSRKFVAAAMELELNWHRQTRSVGATVTP